MSVLWVLPLIVFTLGAVGLAVVAGQWQAEVARLQRSYDGLRGLQDELTLLGSDVRTARAQVVAVADNAAVPSLRAPWRR